MNTYPQNPNVPPLPPTPPVVPKPKKKRNPWMIAVLIGLPVLGFGMGQAAAGGPPETVTETETVEVTNPACVEALDAADTMIENMGEALDISSDAMGHVTSFDWTALDEDTRKLEDLTPVVAQAREDYDVAAVTCRVSAE